MSSQSASQSTSPPYELYYWPSIPGRGEFIRLAFEATNTPYHDIGNASPTGVQAILSACCDPNSTGDPAGNPPTFAPPALRHGTLYISQTPNILMYLGPKLGLAGADPDRDAWHVNALTLTALDLSNEAHDTHHPIATGKYYEDQKPQALEKAADFRKERIPKFLGYFERVLRGNAERTGVERGTKAEGFLVGGQLTYADLTLWQVLSGIHYGFPNEMKARKGEFPLVEQFFEKIGGLDELKAYLASGRRLAFSNGVFRHYPELDRQE